MTQEEKNKWILDQWDKESLAREWIREHLKYNNLKENYEELQQKNILSKSQRERVQNIINCRR